LEIVDQDHSIDLMRSGKIVAALSANQEPAHGFKAFHLGQMSYRAVSSSKYKNRYFYDGVIQDAIYSAPSVRYCNRDNLQNQWLEQVFGSTCRVSAIRLPSSKALLDACLNGTAWGMIAEFRIRKHLDNKSLVELIPNQSLQKDLYWHVSSAMAETLIQLTSSVRTAARKHLSS
jgi:LysR family transcriptional regulator (chromosome initiation inhibitor)